MGGRSFLLRALILLAVLAAGYVVWRERGAPAGQETAEPPAVPVQLVTPARRDVPIYHTGLGTVQAFNTVNVTTQVDGQILQIGFVEGHDVKAGDLLAQIDPQPFQAALDQALASKSQHEVQLAEAKIEFARFSDLARQRAAPAQQVDMQRALVGELEAQVVADEAVIQSARTNLAYTRIVSPIAGRTGIRLVDQGNIVRAANVTPIVVVTQLQPISVIFTLAEQNLPAVQAAMAAGAVTVLATPRGGTGVEARGTLAVLDNQIDQTTGTIKLKASFANADEALWPGQFVDVRLVARIEHETLTVPSTALQRGPDGYYVYVVEAGQKVAIRPLEVGQIAGGTAVVRGGLAGAEDVVASGQYRLAPGFRVIPRQSQTAAEDPP